MFGKKSAKYEEQIKAVFSGISEHREAFESRVSQLEEMSTCLQADIDQMMENTGELANYAMRNIEEESLLLHNMDDFSRELKNAVDEYALLKEAVLQQMEASTALVEENKHFTTPSKYLSEAPGAMKEIIETYESRLDEMSEYGKKMGVLALNAAIEAGRMGEGGKQFVSAAEEIRQTAMAYEKAAVSMKEEVTGAREKIGEMEEVIHHLITLLKESNMGNARLMKKCVETSKIIEKSSMRDFSNDMIVLRDRVVATRNLEEEIAKIGERNKLQLCDIREDIQSQKNEILEVESDLSHLLDTAEEQLS